MLWIFTLWSALPAHHLVSSQFIFSSLHLFVSSFSTTTSSSFSFACLYAQRSKIRILLCLSVSVPSLLLWLLHYITVHYNQPDNILTPWTKMCCTVTLVHYANLTTDSRVLFLHLRRRSTSTFSSKHTPLTCFSFFQWMICVSWWSWGCLNVLKRSCGSSDSEWKTTTT